MNFEEFVNKYNGKATDYDGGYGVQCVDLVKLYMDKVLNIKIGAIGNAEAYWNRYNELPILKNNFEAIKNTPKFVPQKGDIMIWNKNRGGGCGHVAICNGVGTTSYFCSYDQNWNGTKAMQLVQHAYSNVYGVIRPKNQSNINGLKNGDIVEVDLKVGICCPVGEFLLCDNFVLRSDRRQFEVHKSVVFDDRLIARATVCAVEENEILIQVFEGEIGRQFWVPNSCIKKL